MLTLNGTATNAHGLEELETEYRWSVLKKLVTPIMQRHHNAAAGVWFNNLEKILLAVDDLNCMELLERRSTF